jgi:hypothetical protein
MEYAMKRIFFAVAIAIVTCSCTPQCRWSDFDDLPLNEPLPHWSFNIEGPSISPMPGAIVDAQTPITLLAYVYAPYLSDEYTDVVAYLFLDGRKVAMGRGGVSGLYSEDLLVFTDLQLEPNSGEHIATVVVAIEPYSLGQMSGCYNVYDSYSWSFTVE